MKLTDDQREQLVEAMQRDFVDIMTGNVHRDRIATLVESWLSSPPEGWGEREQWEAPVLFGGAYGVVSQARAEHMIRVEQRSGLKSHVRHRTIWESPWEDA